MNKKNIRNSAYSHSQPGQTVATKLQLPNLAAGRNNWQEQHHIKKTQQNNYMFMVSRYNMCVCVCVWLLLVLLMIIKLIYPLSLSFGCSSPVLSFLYYYCSFYSDPFPPSRVSGFVYTRVQFVLFLLAASFWSTFQKLKLFHSPAKCNHGTTTKRTSRSGRIFAARAAVTEQGRDSRGSDCLLRHGEKVCFPKAPDCRVVVALFPAGVHTYREPYKVFHLSLHSDCCVELGLCRCFSSYRVLAQKRSELLTAMQQMQHWPG